MPTHLSTLATLADWSAIPKRQRQRWYISESVTREIPIADANDDPLVDIAERAEHERLPMRFAPVAPEHTPRLFLRRDAANRLMNAARALKDATNGTVVFKVTDAFRPLALQRKYFDEISKDIAEREGLTGEALWERTTNFIADPDGCPPHATGGAIDLTLVTLPTGQELPMGTPVDTIDDRANTWHPKIRGVERKNRELLFRTMTTAGFVNLATEWWHYSFGDQYWAAYLEKPQALYGTIETLPPQSNTI